MSKTAKMVYPEIIANEGSLTGEGSERLFYEALDRFIDTLSLFGILVRRDTPESRARMRAMSPSTLMSLTDHFTLQSQWLNEELSYGPPAKGRPLPVARERRIVERVLSHMGWQVDESFWSTVSEGDLIEIYGQDMVQVYRNLEFFALCGYSLLEVSTIEWFDLWERPTSILKEMMEMAKSTFEDDMPVRAYNIPRHILRETRPANPQTGYQPRASLVDFKVIAPIRMKGHSKVAGAMVTSRGQNLAMDSCLDQLVFL